VCNSCSLLQTGSTPSHDSHRLLWSHLKDGTITRPAEGSELASRADPVSLSTSSTSSFTPSQSTDRSSRRLRRRLQYIEPLRFLLRCGNCTAPVQMPQRKRNLRPCAWHSFSCTLFSRRGVRHGSQVSWPLLYSRSLPLCFCLTLSPPLESCPVPYRARCSACGQGSKITQGESELSRNVSVCVTLSLSYVTA
jgi:hypothetical protein